MFEYAIILFEYYKTCKKSYLLSNFVISLLVGSLIFLVSDTNSFDDSAKNLIQNMVSILGILLGFSISMFTLLNTASNPNIDEIKKKETGYKLYNKPVFLFDLLLVSLVYIIVFESFLLIINLLFPFFFNIQNLLGKVSFCIDVLLLVHVILVNVSTTVDFYFIASKKRQ